MNFISKKTILKHWLILSLIAIALIFGLLTFLHFQDRIGNFKAYYFDSVQYDIKALFKERNATSREYGNATAVPVLLYHGITEKGDGYGVGYKEFKDQMFTLYDMGYRTISVEDYFLFLNGKKNIPEKSFLLTFDDGRKDSYYPVDPLLKYLDFRAVMFVLTEQSLDDNDSSYYLDKSEIARMINSNRWDIGVHAKDSHQQIKIDENGETGNFLSNKKWQEELGRLETDNEFRSRIHNEVNNSKIQFINEINMTPDAFAFPFGDYGQNSINYPATAQQVIIDEISKAYDGAFTQTKQDPFSYNSPMTSNILSYRIEITSNDNTQKVIKKITQGMAKKLPYTADYGSGSGWFVDWGEASMDNRGIEMSAMTDGTGARVILDGGQYFKDYKFSLTAKGLNGESITYYANYLDNDNYISCTTTDKYTRLDVNRNGNKTTLSRISNPKDFDIRATNKFEIFSGDLGNGCSLNNNILVNTANNIDINRRGSIGVSIWDENEGSSSVFISELKAETID